MTDVNLCNAGGVGEQCHLDRLNTKLLEEREVLVLAVLDDGL